MDELKPGRKELNLGPELTLAQISETTAHDEPAPAPPTDYVEQRRFPRIRCFLAVQVRSANDRSLVVAKLNDVSLGGCGVESPTPVRIGFQVSICPLASNGALWVEGVVVNTRLAEGASSYHIEVRFLDVDAAAASVGEFVRFVEKTAEKQAAPNSYLTGLSHGKA